MYQVKTLINFRNIWVCIFLQITNGSTVFISSGQHSWQHELQLRRPQDLDAREPQQRQQCHVHGRAQFELLLTTRAQPVHLAQPPVEPRQPGLTFIRSDNIDDFKIIYLKKLATTILIFNFLIYFNDDSLLAGITKQSNQLNLFVVTGVRSYHD